MQHYRRATNGLFFRGTVSDDTGTVATVVFVNGDVIRIVSEHPTEVGKFSMDGTFKEVLKFPQGFVQLFTVHVIFMNVFYDDVLDLPHRQGSPEGESGRCRCREIFTDDSLEYQFFPVTAGSLHFKVRAANDAHVALASGPSEKDQMYEVLIGGWGNTKTGIRRNRQKPEKVITITKDILNDDKYRDFWIRWCGGCLAVGITGESTPFLTWHDPEPFGIGYYGICTGFGATGSWIIEDGSEINTEDKLKYNFLPVPAGRLELDVRSSSDAHVALASSPSDTEPIYEIILGGWENSASVIRLNKTTPDKVRKDTPDLLTLAEPKQFVIEWRGGLVQVEKDGEVLLEWHDPNPFGITHFGVRTPLGSKGHWHVASVNPDGATLTAAAEHEGSEDPSNSSALWVDASGGNVPPKAVPFGLSTELLYVGRAEHEGALIPGKLVPSQGVCYIPWGGEEHSKHEYQVLVDCKTIWVPVAGRKLPPKALPAGKTEDGEPLFVGRVSHEGTHVVGKVHASHNTCYIPYGGTEISYQQYEVLVTK